jgi:hypothetical protein
VRVRLDDVASFIVNADYDIERSATGPRPIGAAERAAEEPAAM